MKKVDLSNVVSGVRSLFAQKATFQHIQESYTEIFSSILKGLLANPNSTDIIRLHGIYYNTPIVGGLHDISEGAVFYNGEVFQVPAFLGTATVGQVPVLNIQTSYRAGDPVIYSDNNLFNTHEIKRMVVSLAASGSGLSDYNNIEEFSNRIFTDLLSIDDLLAFKANKQQENWQNATMDNGWVSDIAKPVQFRVTEFGEVVLRGKAKSNLAVSGIAIDGLPTPSFSITQPQLVHDGVSLYQYKDMVVTASGSGSFDGYLSSPTYYNATNAFVILDGIRYWIN